MLPALWNDSVPAPMSGGPINRLSSIFDRMMGEAGQFAEAWSGVPTAIWEDEDHFYIEAELPGLTSEDVEITAHNGRLFIRGERKAKEDRTYLYDGRCYGRFERVINLPEAVVVDSVDAHLQDGVLHFTLPKSPEAKPKKISLRTS